MLTKKPFLKGLQCLKGALGQAVYAIPDPVADLYTLSPAVLIKFSPLVAAHAGRDYITRLLYFCHTFPLTLRPSTTAITIAAATPPTTDITVVIGKGFSFTIVSL